MTARVMIVAAHPDDEVLGAGGTAARRTAAGDDVAVLILGEGVTARYATRDPAPRSLVVDIQERARRAGEVLGVKDMRFAGLPDNRFDAVDFLDIVKTVEARLDEFRPSTVYTHHAGDLNVDHRLAFQAVLTATRPAPDCPVLEVQSFEVPSSTDWSFGRLGASFSPSVFVDISETLERKLAALAHYADEIRPAPHARSLDAVRAAATRWGATVGRRAVEAFECVRVIQ